MKLVSKLEPIKSESTQSISKIESTETVIDRSKNIKQTKIEFDQIFNIKMAEVYNFTSKLKSELKSHYEPLLKTNKQLDLKTKWRCHRIELGRIKSKLISQLNVFSTIKNNSKKIIH